MSPNTYHISKAILSVIIFTLIFSGCISKTQSGTEQLQAYDSTLSPMITLKIGDLKAGNDTQYYSGKNYPEINVTLDIISWDDSPLEMSVLYYCLYLNGNYFGGDTVFLHQNGETDFRMCTDLANTPDFITEIKETAKNGLKYLGITHTILGSRLSLEPSHGRDISSHSAMRTYQEVISCPMDDRVDKMILAALKGQKVNLSWQVYAACDIIRNKEVYRFGIYEKKIGILRDPDVPIISVTERGRSGISDSPSIEDYAYQHLTLDSISSAESKVPTAEEWNDKGIALARIGRYVEALNCFDKAIDINPHIATIWYNRGSVLCYMGKYKESIKDFDMSIQIDPRAPEVWSNKGFALYQQAEYDEALRCFNEVISIDPYDYRAWDRKGLALTQMGDYENAIKSFDNAIEIYPFNVTLWDKKGGVLYRMGKYNEAISAEEKAIEINPKYVNAWNIRGRALYQLGKYAESNQAFDQIIEISPGDQEAWSIKGRALYQMKKYNDSIQVLDRATEINPQDAEAWFIKGLALMALDKNTEADAAFIKARKLGIIFMPPTAHDAT